MKVTRTQLRRIISEAMGELDRGMSDYGPDSNLEFPSLSHPLLRPYFNKLGYRNTRGGSWFKAYQNYNYNAGGASEQSITVYLLPNGKYTARVNGSYNNTISAQIKNLGMDFDTAESAIEAALRSSPSSTGPSAADLLSKVGEKVDTSGYNVNEANLFRTLK